MNYIKSILENKAYIKELKEVNKKHLNKIQDLQKEANLLDFNYLFKSGVLEKSIWHFDINSYNLNSIYVPPDLIYPKDHFNNFAFSDLENLEDQYPEYFSDIFFTVGDETYISDLKKDDVLSFIKDYKLNISKDCLEDLDNKSSYLNTEFEYLKEVRKLVNG